jgi:hypothetical protein
MADRHGERSWTMWYDEPDQDETLKEGIRVHREMEQHCNEQREMKKTHVLHIKMAIADFLRKMELPENHAVYIIAGAALYLHDIRDEFVDSDVDLIVPGMEPMCGYVREHCGLTIDAGGSLYVANENVTDMVASRCVRRDGLLLMGLEDLLVMKLSMNRKKDHSDIDALKHALGYW